MRFINGIGFAATTVLVATVLTGCSEPAVNLQIGECFNASDADLRAKVPLSSVETVDCEETHNSEIFAVREIKADSYPGAEKLAAEAAGWCPRAFEEYTGTGYNDSDAGIYPLAPSENSWNRFDDRTLSCVALTIPAQKGSLHEK